jgi:hypothetical protein
MEPRLITYEELVGLRDLNDEAENLREKARILVRGLANQFGGTGSVGGIPDMLIKQSDDTQILGTVTSTFGTGRFMIAFRTEGKTVKAQLIVERMIRDQRERETWEPVMAIQLPKPVWVVDGEPVSDRDKAFVLGASILHAIINGRGTAN